MMHDYTPAPVGTKHQRPEALDERKAPVGALFYRGERVYFNQTMERDDGQDQRSA